MLGDKIILAAANGDVTGLNALLINNAGKINYEYIDENDLTALMAACGYGHAECVKLLLLNGANVNFATKIGSPLIIAVIRGYLDVIKELFNNQITETADINYQDADGYTALMVAAGFEMNPLQTDVQAEIVSLLLSKNPNFSLKNKKTEPETALDICHFNKNKIIWDLLMKHICTRASNEMETQSLNTNSENSKRSVQEIVESITGIMTNKDIVEILTKEIILPLQTENQKNSVNNSLNNSPQFSLAVLKQQLAYHKALAKANLNVESINFKSDEEAISSEPSDNKTPTDTADNNKVIVKNSSWCRCM